MSFSRLPTELKQHLIDLIHQADQNYLEREKAHRSANRSLLSQPVLDVTLRGRGLDNFSRVNQECRNLCSKILWKNLKVSKAKDRIFQYGLLRTAAASFITHLLIDTKADLDDLRLVLFHIVPKLPNLSSITIERTASLPQRGGASYSTKERQFNLIELENLARSITTWSFNRNQPSETIKALLGANPSIVQSVSLAVDYRVPTDPSIPPIPVLPSLSLLGPCSSLSTLNIHLPTSSESTLVDNNKWFDMTALLDKYAFANRLTSLSITAKSDKSPQSKLEISVLQFTTLFQSLRHLDLHFGATSFRDLPPSSSESDSAPVFFSLPNLQSLHLHFDYMSAALETLRLLRLPSLQILRFTANTVALRSRRAIEQDQKLTYSFAKRIEQLKKTLKKVVFKCEDREMEESFGLCKLMILNFSRTKYRTEVDVKVSPSATYVRVRDLDGMNLVTEEERIDQEFKRNVDSVVELAVWLQSRQHALFEEERLEEADQLWKACRELKKYKDWICD